MILEEKDYGIRNVDHELVKKFYGGILTVRRIPFKII